MSKSVPIKKRQNLAEKEIREILESSDFEEKQAVNSAATVLNNEVDGEAVEQTSRFLKPDITKVSKTIEKTEYIPRASSDIICGKLL